MNKPRCVTLIVLLFCAPLVGRAQTQPAEIPLWANGAPGARGNAPTDIPTITPYIVANASAPTTAVIIMPGGGYTALSMDKEGSHYAQFLNQQGVSAFVLKYRLGRTGYRHPAMLQDATRAIRTVRARAEEWKIDVKRVGVMGSSAGGHLASSIMTHFDAGDANASDPIEKQNSRPDFGILCYPVITMGEKTHAGSKNMLLGENPSPELIKEMSSELQVTPQTPPCFIWHGLNDRTVPIENAIEFAMALKKNGVPFDLHIYQNAPHGLGLPINKPLPWSSDLLLWMNTNKLLPEGNTAPSIGGGGPPRGGAATRGGAR